MAINSLAAMENLIMYKAPHPQSFHISPGPAQFSDSDSEIDFSFIINSLAIHDGNLKLKMVCVSLGL